MKEAFLIACLLALPEISYGETCSFSHQQFIKKLDIKTHLARTGLWDSSMYNKGFYSTRDIPENNILSKRFNLYQKPSIESPIIGYYLSLILPRTNVQGYLYSIETPNSDGGQLPLFSETDDWGYANLGTYPVLEQQGQWIRIPTSRPLKTGSAWINFGEEKYLNQYTAKGNSLVLIKNKPFTILRQNENGIYVRPQQENYDFTCNDNTQPLQPYTESFFPWCSLYKKNNEGKLYLDVKQTNPRGC